jgi:hypothetical protein
MFNKKKEFDINKNKGLIITKIDNHWTKMNRDAIATFYVNDIVKDHLVWTSGVVNNQENTPQQTAKVSMIEGKLPFILNAREMKKAEYENSLFKTPDILFNLDTGDAKQDQLLKQFYLHQLEKGGVINAYMGACETRLSRGEAILFHQWEKKYAKRRIEKEILKEDGTKEYNFEIEKYIEWEGVTVKKIEPYNFIFDHTKIPPYTSAIYDNEAFAKSSCIKIAREWLPINDILNDDRFDDLSQEDTDKLKSLVNQDTPPATEQNKDDYTDRFKRRRVFGDMIEIFHFYGDLSIGDNILEDYHIITAGSAVMLKCEESPYTLCPIVWCPDLVDFPTGRGISSLVPAVYLNETATKFQLAIQDALKFSLNPAYLTPQDFHLPDNKKKIQPGDFVQYSCTDLNQSNPLGGIKEIDSYKNVPLTTEFIDRYEKYIQDATSTMALSASATQGFDNKTATQTMQEITSGNTRFGAEMLGFVNFAIMPSLKIITKMTAENLNRLDDDGNENQIDVKLVEGGKTQKQNISIDLIKQNTDISIGTIQAITEKKAKIAQLLQQIQTYQGLGLNFDLVTAWLYTSSVFEIQNADTWIQSDQLQQILKQMLPEMAEPIKQSLTQLASNPQQLQQIIQQLQQQSQPQPQIQQIPINKFMNDIAAQAVWKDANYLTVEQKITAMQQNGIIPPLDIQLDIETEQQKIMQKQAKLQQLIQGV